jgi:hypothetical protein
MTIVRLSNGGLAAHSVIACDEATMKAIDELGPVEFVIVPNPYHTMDAPAWKGRYPAAKVIAPAPACAAVARKLPVDGDYSLLPQDARLATEPLDGFPVEGVLIYRDSGGATTLVFTDALFNLPDKLPGFGGWLMSVLGSTGGPKVTFIARLFMVRDRARYAAHLRRLSVQPNLVRAIPGHGAILDKDVPGTLRAVADRLHPASRGEA